MLRLLSCLRSQQGHYDGAKGELISTGSLRQVAKIRTGASNGFCSLKDRSNGDGRIVMSHHLAGFRPRAGTDAEDRPDNGSRFGKCPPSRNPFPTPSSFR
jgi:hypothetical protein